MPVRFEQPSPLAPGITAGAGAAQQYSRDLPTLASLYESLARRGGGGGGHGYHNPFPQGAGGDRGMTMLGGGQHGSGGGGQPLNQAESLRLARLQAADAAIDADETLSPREKQRYKLQIHAGLDPLMEKQKAAKAQMMQEQYRQMMEQHAQMTAMQGESDAARAAAYAKRLIRNPDTGQVMGFLDHKGDMKPLPAWELQSRKEAEEAKHEEAERKARAAEFHQDTKAAMDMLTHEKDEEGKPVPPNPDKVEQLAERIRLNREKREKNYQFWKGQGPGAVPGGPPEQAGPGAAIGAAPIASGQPPDATQRIIQEAMQKHMPEMAPPREDVQAPDEE